MLTENELRQRLDELIAACGSQSSAARALGVSAPFLGDVLKRHRPLGTKIPAYFGYREVRCYVKDDSLGDA